jgi:hypothetical protein
MMHISHAAHGYFSQPASAAPQLAFSAAWHGVGGGGGGGAAKAPAAIAVAKIIVATIAAAARNVVFSSGLRSSSSNRAPSLGLGDPHHQLQSV